MIGIHFFLNPPFFVSMATAAKFVQPVEKFKMAAVAMVTKVQKMLNSLQTADPFET
jgi:hypothetical protein